MNHSETLYAPEKAKERIALTEDQKDAIRGITLDIEEIDETIRSMAVEDVIRTLENGHPLNRVIGDPEGEVSGYIACEDFVSHEAYIKYFGTTGQSGRNLLREIPAFLRYAKEQGYTKLNFHGWNDRLNHILERYGFARLRTDSMADFSVDFYEKTIVEQKTSEDIEQERRRAFEEKYLYKIGQEYQETLATFGADIRPDKEHLIADTHQQVHARLAAQEGFVFEARQQAILKLKLARYFQETNSCDISTLVDAIIESPKFINTDKGSLHRLFEVHEEKTLQKIAEIRKKRAEITGKEAFNPYEALFTTQSGNYYMARLLNMPHLEEESAYLKHCVGTSDSYINKMKRGEIEILSFRHAPKINPVTQKLQGDAPIITIEYNLKTKVIEQMKKQNDEFLRPSDPYYLDVIDALKQLSATTTDAGTVRTIAKIEPGELQHLTVADYHVLTDRGEVALRDFNPDDGAFVLKRGVMEITPDMSKEDIAKIMRVVSGIDCTPDQIAQRPADITGTTKVYLGPLEPGIFDKLAKVEHIYTAFPERPVRRHPVEVGGKTGQEYERLITQIGDKVYGTAEFMLKSREFRSVTTRHEMTLVELSVRDLGFDRATRRDAIYARAKELGLEICPAEAGPALRLAYPDQPLNEWVLVGMEPITDADGSPEVFVVERDGGGRWLDRNDGRPGDEWDPDDRWVFVLSRK